MQFEELKNEVKGVSFDTLRFDADNNFEAVIVKDELKKLTSRLEKFFGSPVFPSQTRLTLQVRQVIEGFGGVAVGQTLYFWNQGSDTIFAMLWPWQDGYRTTVKLIKK
jgi:hypothetical protein